MLDHPVLKILLCTDPVDMRKAIDGLTLQISEYLEMDPQSEYLFIFGNKTRNKVKMIYWDRNGFVLIYKRLEKGRFKIPKNLSNNKLLLTEEELNWFLSGLEFHQIKAIIPKKLQSYA